MTRLEILADFCRKLPGASEDIKWGNDLVFSVGGKMFCVFSIEREKLVRISFKVEDHRFLEYTDRPEFIPAPYMARARWVSLIDAAAVPRKELETAIRTSWELVFAKLTKRLQNEIRPA